MGNEAASSFGRPGEISHRPLDDRTVFDNPMDIHISSLPMRLMSERFPLRFHPRTHSDCIHLTHEGRRARRTKRGSMCGLCFTQRPVCTDERIYLRLVSISHHPSSSGTLRFGITSSCPDGMPLEEVNDHATMPEGNGRCLRSVPEAFVQRGNMLHFYAAENGDIMFNVNESEQGVFISPRLFGITADQHVWIVMDLYGQGSTVELQESVPQGHRASSSSLSMSQQFALQFGPSLLTHSSVSTNPLSSASSSSSSIMTHQQLKSVSSSHSIGDYVPYQTPSHGDGAVSLTRSNRSTSTNDAMRRATPPRRSQCSLPMPFNSSLHGRNIMLSDDCMIASRTRGEYCNGYVFTQRCLRLGETLTISVLDVTREYKGGLAFGVTTCDPTSIRQEALPDDSDLLLNRPEYWVVHKDICIKPERDDQLSFQLTLAGEICYSRNGHVVGTLMYVDTSVPLYAFFDIYGTTSIILSQGVTSVETHGGLPASLSPHQPPPWLDISTDPRPPSSSDNTSSASQVPVTPDRTTSIRHYPAKGPKPRAPVTPEQRPQGSASMTPSDPQHRVMSSRAVPVAGRPINNSRCPPLTPADINVARSNLAHQRPAPTHEPARTLNPPPSTPQAGLQSPLDTFIDMSNALPPPLIPMPSPSVRLPIKSLSPPDVPRTLPSPHASIAPTPSAGVRPPIPRRRSEAEVDQRVGAGGGPRSVRSSVSGVSGADQDLGNNECAVCMECAPDCVLYTCGHMCMCYSCAIDVVARSGDCPICREPIRDVIKIFRS